MMTYQSVMGGFGVHPGSCMSLAIATDGLKMDANILMLALTGFNDTTMSVFITGGDVMATQRFTGIPKKVYDSLAVDKEVAASILDSKLNELGVTNLVCHQTFRFIKPRLVNAKLVRNSISFVDVGLMHKALGFWTEHLRDSSNLIDLQAKIERMRGKNLIKLEALAELYDAAAEEGGSPYVPVNKSKMIRDVFTAQLNTELPFS